MQTDIADTVTEYRHGRNIDRVKTEIEGTVTEYMAGTVTEYMADTVTVCIQGWRTQGQSTDMRDIVKE